MLAGAMLTTLLVVTAILMPQSPHPIALFDAHSGAGLDFISSTVASLEVVDPASPNQGASRTASERRPQRRLKPHLLREFRYDHSSPASRTLLSKAVFLALLLVALAALRQRPAPWPAILGVAAGLLAFNLVLDLGGVSLSYNQPGIFGRSFAAPLFAYAEPAFDIPVLGHVLLVACFLGLGLTWLLGPTCRAAVFGLIVYAIAIVAPIGLGLSSQWQEVLHQFYPSGLDYVQYLQPLGNTVSMLSGYVDSMPSLSIHASTHGPGPLLGLSLLRAAIGDAPIATAIGLQILGALLPIVTWLTARTLLEEGAARLSAVLVLLSPSFHQFSFVSIDGILAPLLFGTAALLLRCLLAEQQRRTLSALLLGVMVYMCTLWTFSAAFLAPLGLFTAGLAIRWGIIAPRRALQVGLLAASGFIAVHLAMLALGFDLWACFLQARKLNTEMVGSAFRSFSHYFLSSTGNLGAFMIGCGIPVSAMWLSALRTFANERSSGTCIMIGSSATILLLAILGVYQWEVERIWLFLVPLVCIPAARYLHGITRSNPRGIMTVVGVLWLQTLVMELMLNTYW